jgi:hypothetical protein
MNALALSLIRTWVPIIVGAFAAWLLVRGIELDARTQTGLIVSLTGVLQALYYTIARVLETRFPGVGVFLGAAKSPDSYSKDATATADVLDDEGAPEPGDPADLDDAPGKHEAV